MPPPPTPSGEILDVHSFNKHLSATVLGPEDVEEKATASFGGAEILDLLCPRQFSHEPQLPIPSKFRISK